MEKTVTWLLGICFSLKPPIGASYGHIIIVYNIGVAPIFVGVIYAAIIIHVLNSPYLKIFTDVSVMRSHYTDPKDMVLRLIPGCIHNIQWFGSNLNFTTMTRSMESQ